MTRGVEEGDPAAILQFHVVGTDVLGDASSFTGNNVRVTDEVEQ